MKSKKSYLNLFVALFAIIATTFIIAPSAQAGPGHHSGVVLDAKQGGGYTYLHIEEGKDKFWIAGPLNTFKKDDKVNFDEQVWMTNFESKALEMTFEKLLFVGSVNSGLESAAPAPKEKPKKKKKKKKKSGKYKNGDTLTIETIYGNKEDLEDLKISVIGKVAKVSPGIMGKNWIHVRDDTGKEEDGTNNLVFRSARGIAAVGETITATGTVEIDKDFGFGYFYSVIMEESNFEK